MNRPIASLSLIQLLEEEEDDDLLLWSMIKKKRRPIRNIFKTRSQEGVFNILINRHLNSDEEMFRRYCRLNYDQFDFILSLVARDIQGRDSNKRKIISPGEKMFITLRYLATGESFRSLGFSYRISACHIGNIVKVVLRALAKKLPALMLPIPGHEDYVRIAEEFWVQWKFPNCFGGIDGKHIRLRCPNNTGSMYFNYKNYFSMVLLAIVDSNYKFIAIDIGSYGREGDSGIFKKSVMGRKISNNRFGTPSGRNLPGTDIHLPYVIVGDEAFALSSFMMRPYSRRDAAASQDKAIFNYRLCTARRVTENSFALLSQIFRIFYTPIAIDPKTCDDLVMVTCCLHNMLRDAYLEKNNTGPFYRRNPDVPIPTDNMIPLRHQGGFANAAGFEIRNQFKTFFNEAGRVEWQDERINRT